MTETGSDQTTLPTLEFPPIKRSALLRQLAQDPDPPVSNFDDIRDYGELYRDKEERKFVLNKHQQATEVHTMMRQFSEQAHRAIFHRRCSSALRTRQERLDKTDSDRDDLRQVAQDNRRGFGTAAQERWDAMKHRHMLELAEHASKRPGSEVTSKFRKRSAELLDLLIKERRLGFQARFDEVRALRAKIDKQEAMESEAQFQAALADWEQKRRAMEDRHRQEEAVMQHWIDVREQECDQDRDAQLAAMEKRERFLKAEMSEISRFAQSAGRHAVRRQCAFERAPSRGLVDTTPMREQLDKLSVGLPEKAREELLKCRY
jgi:hypothetical protein